MPSAYSIPNCSGWYRSTTGVYSDAGTTPANPGDPVYQWNDLSGANNHLIQSTSANRPIYNTYAASVPSGGAPTVGPYGNPINTYRPSGSSALLFDGANSFLNLPSSISIPNTGCTVLLCTRGSYYCPISFGTDGTFFINYGWFGGAPQSMGINNVIPRTFPSPTYLPELTPIVHGFRCSASLAESRLYLGANQTSALSANWCNFATTGGALGRTLNVNDSSYGNFGFIGEIFELAIFPSPLGDSQIQSLIASMQAANRIRPDANSNQVLFIGDSLTAGGPGTPSVSHCYPATLIQQCGQSFKPLLLATPGHTIAQQQYQVTNNIVTLDLTPFTNTVAVVCIGSNDILLGRTASQVTADLAALCTALRSARIKVILATITPRTTSAGYTTANITTLNSVNATLRTTWPSYADALVDWAIAPQLSDATNTTYYTDQCHTTEAGDAIKASLIKPALDPFIAPRQTSSTYAAFYTPGRTFTATYANFLRS